MKARLQFSILFSILLAVGLAMADQPGSNDNSESKQKAEETRQSQVNLAINWISYDEGLALAKKEGKKVFVEFTAKWCGFCKKMRATTFKNPDIIKLLNTYYVTVSVDGDSRDSLDIDGWITTERRLTREYGITGYPTYWFLTSEADPIAPVKGYRDAEMLGYILDYLKDDLYDTVDFKDYMAQKRQEDKTGN